MEAIRREINCTNFQISSPIRNICIALPKVWEGLKNVMATFNDAIPDTGQENDYICIKPCANVQQLQNFDSFLASKVPFYSNTKVFCCFARNS